MKIQDIKTYHLQIPMRVQFSQSNNTAQTSDAVIVQIITKSGILGYGEACPRTYVTGENIASVQVDIEQLKTQLCATTFPHFAALKHFITAILPRHIGLATTCGLELALLDAWSKEVQEPLVDILGGNTTQTFQYTGVIPFGNIAKMKPLLQRFNFQEIKLKVGTDREENLSRITQIKEIYGSRIPIRVDVNTAWSFPVAFEQTVPLIEAGVTCIEQPFSKERDTSMAFLNREVGDWVDVMADESLTDYTSALRLIQHKNCNRFNIKLSKNGGILNSLRIYRLAQEHGIKCQLGAHFGETSILTMAGLLFASVTQNLEAMEGALGTYLLKRDLTLSSIKINSDAQIDGHFLNNKLGLGLNIDPSFFCHQKRNTTVSY